MALMARRSISLDEKIEKAIAMLAAKTKYHKALDELEKLVTKRKQLDDKKILDVYHAGNKNTQEIIEFIQSDRQKTD